MTEMELRSMMKGYIQDATQSDVPRITLLDRVMEDIEEYCNKRILNNIQAGPYWDKINESKTTTDV
jgi:hypothetical protein